MSTDLHQASGTPSEAGTDSLSDLRYRVTVEQLFQRAVTLWPDRPFVIDGHTISYREMDALVDRIARGFLGLDVKPGERVAVWMSNIWEWVAVQLAVTRIGAVLTPINTRLRVDDLAYILADTGARVVVTQGGSGEFSYEAVLADLMTDRERLPALEHVVVARAFEQREAPSISWTDFLAQGEGHSLVVPTAESQDLAYILYTSGSTSLPKGVMLSHVSLNNALNIASAYAEGDRIFLAYPLFAITGCQNSVLVSIAIGGSLVLQERFDRDQALDLIERHSCTVIAGITQILKELESASGFSTERVASVRVAAIFPRRPEHLELLDRFGISKATTGYGMTETSGPVTYSENLEEVGLEGIPFPGDRIRLVAEHGGEPATGEPGAIQVKTPHGMLGYFGSPEATAAQFDSDGWFDTGDVGCLDADGRLKWLGRSTDIIKSSGFNYAAQEVETFLTSHAEVAELALIGVPDADRGEVGAVFVVAKAGVQFTADDLKAICANRIASYKIPQHLFVVDALPKTATGKVRKVELRQWYDEKGGQNRAV